MKIQFVKEGMGIMEGTDILITEINVKKVPTSEETHAIYEYINEKIEESDEVNIEDYTKICEDACNKFIEVENNPVVKTFYL